MTNNKIELVEITLPDPDKFLMVKETLTRIGIAAKNKKELYQSCHILHKKGKYYIVHFKEMFMLDGRETTFDETDKDRRNRIIKLLESWNLLKPVKNIDVDDNNIIRDIRVVSSVDKKNWELKQKYHLGQKNRVFNVKNSQNYGNQ